MGLFLELGLWGNSIIWTGDSSGREGGCEVIGVAEEGVEMVPEVGVYGRRGTLCDAGVLAGDGGPDRVVEMVKRGV